MPPLTDPRVLQISIKHKTTLGMHDKSSAISVSTDKWSFSMLSVWADNKIKADIIADELWIISSG